MFSVSRKLNTKEQHCNTNVVCIAIKLCVQRSQTEKKSALSWSPVEGNFCSSESKKDRKTAISSSKHDKYFSNFPALTVHSASIINIDYNDFDDRSTTATSSNIF